MKHRALGQESVTDSAPPGKAFFYGYVIVTAAFFILSSVWGIAQSFGVFLKPMSEEFGWSRAATSGAFTTYMLMVGGIYIFTGRLTDQFGPRKIVTVCGLLFGLGHILLSQVSEIWQLYVLYGLVIPLGASGSFVPMAATIARWFVRRRGLMTGIALSGIGIGTMLFPVLITWMISISSWRNAYLACGIISLTIITFAAQFLKRDPSEIGKLPYGYNEASNDNPIQLQQGFTFLDALRMKQFWLLCIAYLVCGITPWTITVHIVPHATDIGLSPIAAANIMTVIGLLNFAGKIMVGNIADYMGTKRALLMSFAFLLASLIWLQFSREAWMFYIFGIIFGIGWAGGSSVMSPLVADIFGLRSLGVILAMFNWAWIGGGGLGAYLTGLIFDSLHSYYIAFLLWAILIVAGITLVFFVRPIRMHPVIGGTKAIANE